MTYQVYKETRQDILDNLNEDENKRVIEYIVTHLLGIEQMKVLKTFVLKRRSPAGSQLDSDIVDDSVQL